MQWPFVPWPSVRVAFCPVAFVGGLLTGDLFSGWPLVLEPYFFTDGWHLLILRRFGHSKTRQRRVVHRADEHTDMLFIAT